MASEALTSQQGSCKPSTMHSKTGWCTESLDDWHLVTVFCLVCPFLEASDELVRISIIVSGLLARQSPATPESKLFEQQLDTLASIDMQTSIGIHPTLSHLLLLGGLYRSLCGGTVPRALPTSTPLRPAAAALQRIEAHTLAISYVTASRDCLFDLATPSWSVPSQG